MVIKILMLIIFFGIMLTIGFLCRSKSSDVNGFVLGGRNAGPWLTAFAYGTSYFSAVIFVGYAGQFGWKFGIASTWIGIGNAILGSYLAWSVLGRRTRIMTQHLGSATMPHFFEKRFGAPSLKIVASIVIFIFMIPYTASLYNGLSRLFEMAFGIPYFWCVLVMSVLTAIYVIAGGYMATAVNDFIQGLVMLVGIVAVIAAVLGQKGGFFSSLVGLAAVTDAETGIPGVFNSFLGPKPFDLLGVVLLTSFGTWGLPQMVGKFYAIKSENHIQKGTVISTIFALVVAGGCYFLGGFGRLFVTAEQLADGGFDSIIPTMLSDLPDFLIGIVIILVLSASMSTLSSLVLTSASTVTLDLLKGQLNRKMSDKTQVLTMRILIFVFILISAAIAVVQAGSPVAFIAQAMGVSWGAMAGAFLAPFLYGLYWKGTTKAGCMVSMAFSVTFMSIVMLVNLGVFELDLGILRSPINSGAFCMIAGLILVPLISCFTRKPESGTVTDAFACYDQKVVVRQADTLGDGEIAE